MLLLPPCGESVHLQGSRVAVRLPLSGLLDELAEELILKLGVGQTHLQGALGQRDVVVDGRSIDGHIDEKLTGLRRQRMRNNLWWSMIQTLLKIKSYGRCQHVIVSCIVSLIKISKVQIRYISAFTMTFKYMQQGVLKSAQSIHTV